MTVMGFRCSIACVSTTFVRFSAGLPLEAGQERKPA